MALSGGGHAFSPRKHILLNFMGAFLVFDSLPSMTWPHPPDNATPSNFLSPKSLDQELFADVTFVSVLAMVLSEY